MADTVKISKANLLVVEGHDDELFFNALVKHLNLGDIQVLPIGGKTKLRENLRVLAISPGFSDAASLTIVRDADDNPKGAFQSVQDALKSAALPSPEKPFERYGQEPQVMVMILPEEGKAGALEDLCLNSVADDSIIYCVEKHFSCLEEQEISLPQNPAKAKVQVFLGSKEKSGKRLGEAAQAGYWPMDSDAFAQIRKCLRELGE